MTVVETIEGDIEAGNFIGNVQGNVTGAVLGNVTGNLTGNVTGNVTGSHYGGEVIAPVVQAGNGALPIPTAEAVYPITKGSIAALTIIAPTAGTDDGKRVWVYSETAFAHVLTCASDGFNAKGASGQIALGGAIGDGFLLIARNGHWYVLYGTNATIT